MRTGCVEARIAGCANVNHGGYVEIDHFFVYRVPVMVAQRRGIPEPTGWIEAEVAANEFKFINATLELCYGVGKIGSGRLR